jgi:hypothetical protein
MIKIISIEILDQLQRHLSQLTCEQFSQRLAVFNSSSIGGHSRHVIEFYDCLLQSVETGVVNYDTRQRDMQIEQNLEYALAIIQKMIDKLEKINNFDQNLLLASEFGAFRSENTVTSFEREAIYLIEHSIHHFALIRIGLQTNFQHIAVEPNFGIAYSTVAFRKEKSSITKSSPVEKI